MVSGNQARQGEARQGELAQLAEHARRELDRDAPRLARRLFPRPAPDSADVGPARYAAYLARNWSDPSFRARQALLNPAALLSVVGKAEAGPPLPD